MSGDLQQQAEAFAKDLSDLTSAFTGRLVPFGASAVGSRFVVAPVDGGVPVSVGGQPLLSVEISYRCRFDHQGDYLAIHTSEIKVHPGARPRGEPLFRYDYVREQKAGLPAAHVQIHAHRDQFTHIMTLAGQAGARRRQASTTGVLEVARLCNLHFPLGGHRFRPGLEDVLQMLHSEFGADTGQTWADVLGETREKYRRAQTGAVVRDCPSEAVRVLRDMGYTVTPPAAGAEGDRVERFTAF